MTRAAISVVVFWGFWPIFCQVPPLPPERRYVAETIPPPSSSTTESPSWKDAVWKENAKCVVFIHTSFTYKNGTPDFSEGTGFIISPGGYVLTCNHVIPDLQEPTPEGQIVEIKEIKGAVGGRQLAAYNLEVIARDKEHDLCVLRLPQNPIPWPTIQTIGEPYVPAEIISLGFPADKDLIPQEGAINSDHAPGGRLTTNTLLSHGMSGGPVFDRTKAVVAVVEGGRAYEKGTDALIPIRFAMNLLNMYASRDLIKRNEQLERVREGPNPVSFAAPSSTPTEAKLYKRKADRGDASAQANLGWLYERGEGVPKDVGKAAELSKVG